MECNMVTVSAFSVSRLWNQYTSFLGNGQDSMGEWDGLREDGEDRIHIDGYK